MSHSNHIYYDISLENTSTIPIQASLFENRNVPLIKNPNDYFLSVVRFCIPTAYIPIFVWQESPTVANTPNNTYYSVTIRRAGTDYRTFLVYVPQNNLSSVDPNYLFVYSYQQFIDAINIALNTSFMAAGGTATQPPYLIYDAATGLISLIGEYAYANVAGEYEIYMNAPLFAFFDNFLSKRLGYNQVNGKDVLLYVENTGNNDYMSHPPGYPLSGTNNAYKMQQEYCSLFNWSSARSIVFISNTIPVASENINAQIQGTQSNGTNSRKILTDFEFQIQTGVSNNSLRSYIQYYPQGPYRLIDLESNQPLYQTDIQLYFETEDQKLYPLFINPNEYISIKLMFRSKRLGYLQY